MAIGDDTLIGNDGPDTLEGFGGNDLLQALGGHDTVVGGRGNDTLDGGAGNDTLDGDDPGDTVPGADSLSGGADDDVLRGGPGNDTLSGGAGDDYLDGGAGNDTLIEDFFGGASDTLVGGLGDDVLQGSEGSVIDGGEGNDRISGSYASVSAGAGNDTIMGSGSAPTGLIEGGEGYDVFELGAFVVDDLVLVGAQLEALRGIEELALGVNHSGANHDRFVVMPDEAVAAGQTLKVVSTVSNFFYAFDGSAETDGHFLILGADDVDNFIGGALADTIVGGAGDDTLQGGGGNDSINGGIGFDRVIYSGNLAGGYTYETVEGGIQVTDIDLSDGDDGMDILRDVNFLVFADTTIEIPVPGLHLVGTDASDDLEGGEGDDTIDGLAGNDTLTGLTGADVIDGGSGNDLLEGGEGADSMSGGTGNDTYFVDDEGDVVIETTNAVSGLVLPGGGAGKAVAGVGDTVIAAIDYSLASLQSLQYVENITLSGAASRATGNALANVLNGNEGDDTLSGAGANDTLDGGAGSDSMIGGTGNDTYIVDATGDTAVEAAQGGGTDTVRASVSETLDANVEHLVLTGTAANGTGNGLANKVTGNGGKNRLNGSGGNDTLDGGNGADTLTGGAGNDVLVWGAGDRFDGGTGTDRLRTTVSLDLTKVNNAYIKNVETIDLSAAGKQKLTLNASDVLDLSSSTNTIQVLGVAGDTVDIVGAFTRGTVSGAFRTYKVGSGILQIDTDISVV